MIPTGIDLQIMAPCQVISGEGEFKERAWEFLINNEYLIDVDSNYRVIAIMGPQSTGKSTLLNRLVPSTNPSVLCCTVVSSAPPSVRQT